MRIILHAGVQCTDDERLLKTLLRNNRDLCKSRDGGSPFKVIQNFAGQDIDKQSQSYDWLKFFAMILKDTIVQSHTVILSNPIFFGSSKEVIGPKQLYPNSVKLTKQFLHLFAEDDVNLYFSIRNSASFLPSIFETSKLSDFSAFLKT